LLTQPSIGRSRESLSRNGIAGPRRSPPSSIAQRKAAAAIPRTDRRVRGRAEEKKSRYFCLSGTSMAAAATSGVVAQMVEANRELHAAPLTPKGRAPQKSHGKYLLSSGLLICPQCGGHLEARRNPWSRGNDHPDGVRLRDATAEAGHVHQHPGPADPRV